MDIARKKRLESKSGGDKKRESVKSTNESYGNDAKTKKLALSESLRTALCTQAGMSDEAADRIWEEACRESGN